MSINSSSVIILALKDNLGTYHASSGNRKEFSGANQFLTSSENESWCPKKNINLFMS